MKLVEQRVCEFLDITASNAPAPGGGSLSALAGASAAALGQMVANLTLGRKKYAEVEADMQAHIPVLSKVQNELEASVDADSRAFDRYMAALSLPKNTPQELEVRKAAMQEGLKAAVAVPLSVAEKIVSVMPILEEILAKGNSNAVTDGLVSVMMARTGVLGAIYNVRVNLVSIDDEAYVAEISQQCAKLQQQTTDWESRVLAQYPLTGMA